MRYSGGIESRMPINGDTYNPDEFKFEIVDVYKGVKWSDVAISHIDYIACCFALETEILASDINKGNLKDKVKFNTTVTTGEISEGSIQKMSSEKHVNVVDLHTANHNIKITKNHPLFFENIGFISLEQLQKNLTLDIYSDLSRYPRVLTINKTTKEIEYEKLTRLIDLNDVIKTYTIRKVSNNSNYIANGFICKPY